MERQQFDCRDILFLHERCKFNPAYNSVRMKGKLHVGARVVVNPSAGTILNFPILLLEVVRTVSKQRNVLDCIQSQSL